MIPRHNALDVTLILRCDGTWNEWGLEWRSGSRRHSLCDPQTLHNALRYRSFSLDNLWTTGRLEGKRPTERTRRFLKKH